MENRCTLYCYSQLFPYYRKAAIMTIALISCILQGGVASSAAEPVDESFSEKIYFHKSSSHIDPAFRDNKNRLDSLKNFLAASDSLLNLDIEITGSASPEGSESFNRELAGKRLSALSDTLGPIPGLKSRIVLPTAASPSEWPDLRYAEFRASFRRNSLAATADNSLSDTDIENDTSDITADITADGSVRGTAENSPVITATTGSSLHESVTSETRSRFPHLILSTNMLYDAALIPNIGIGVSLNDRFTVWADWMYAWWNNRQRRRYWRIYGGDIELRMQLGHGKGDNNLAGHRIGVYASIVTYDIQFGRSHTGVIGDKFNYAAGITYGYSLPVARRLNIDFSIGIGYQWGRYLKQHLVDTHDVLLSTHNRRWFGPTRAEIGLTWLIGPGNVNSTTGKGGKR